MSVRPTAETDAVPSSVAAVITDLVQAVRVGDDPGIRRLLERLAHVADPEALWRLRDLLQEELDRCRRG